MPYTPVTPTRRRLITKTILSALGKAASEGMAVGDTLVFHAEREVPVVEPDPLPEQPVGLTGASSWVVDHAEVALWWSPVPTATEYLVYRDGNHVATVTGADYSEAVASGATHLYAVAAKNATGVGARSEWITIVTALPSGEPAPDPAPLLAIERIEENHSSVRVTVAPVEGAVDYRIYPRDHDHLKKYSGGNRTVEWNGLPPEGTVLVVEAVGAWGPYQYMDDRTPHAEMHSINGHGIPDSVPNVLARTETFLAMPSPSPLRSYAFFDESPDADTFVEVPHPYSPPLPPGNQHVDLFAFENSKFKALFYAAEKDASRVFNHHRHLMTVLADGPDNDNWGGVNYACVSLVPKIVMRPTPEKPVLHLSFEVDPHFTGRRWIEVCFKEKSAPLLHPNVTRNFPQIHPTGQGQVGVWQIDANGHNFQIWTPTGEPYGTDYSFIKQIESDCVRPDMFWNGGPPHVMRTHWDQNQRSVNDLNRDETWLDLRQRFDLYITRDSFKLMEAGLLVHQGQFAVPLRIEEFEFYISHILYHSDLEHQELLQYAPQERYFIERTPWHDERHWANIALGNLSAIPS